MNLPDVKAGNPVLAEDIQRINAAIKQIRLRSGPGYFLRESSGGTTISFPSSQVGGGEGGNTAVQPCPFKVTDVSEIVASTLVLKIQISQNPILGTATEEFPGGRFPDGMSGSSSSPPYVMEIEQTAGTEYVYVNLLVNQLGEILPATTAITVSSEPDFSTGNSTYQKFLVAVVEKLLDDENKPYIFKITNTCPIVYVQPAPPCPFLVEDDSRDGVARVTVRSGLVANELPDDMTLADTFTVTLATTQTFWVIYCGCVVLNGVIQTGDGDITIFASDSYEQSTASYLFFKLAELTLSQRANEDWYASYILNTCAVPFLAGGGGGGTTLCPYFAVTNSSTGETLSVQVAQGMIAGRWPDGMGLGFPPFILGISESCYIYAGIYWDIATLTIGPDSDAITILQSNNVLENTSSMEYILLATVIVTGSPGAITSIQNVCAQPIPNPCSLDWSTA